MQEADDSIRDMVEQVTKQESLGSVQVEMPKYKSHKTVWALKIQKIRADHEDAQREGRETDGSATITPEEAGYAPFKVDRAYMQKHTPTVGGYYVV